MVALNSVTISAGHGSFLGASLRGLRRRRIVKRASISILSASLCARSIAMSDSPSLLPGPDFTVARLSSCSSKWVHVHGAQLWLADIGFSVLRRIDSRGQGPLARDASSRALWCLDGDLYRVNPRAGSRTLVVASSAVSKLLWPVSVKPHEAASFLWTLSFSQGMREIVTQIDSSDRAALVWIDESGGLVDSVPLPRPDPVAQPAPGGEIAFSAQLGSSLGAIVHRSGSIVADLTSYAAPQSGALRTTGVAFDPVEERVAVGTNLGLLLWSYGVAQVEWIDRGGVCVPSWSPDGRLLGYSFCGSELRIVDIATAPSIVRMIGRTADPIDGNPWRPPIFSADGRFVCAPVLERRDVGPQRTGPGPVLLVADLSRGEVTFVDHATKGIVWIGDEGIELVPTLTGVSR